VVDVLMMAIIVVGFEVAASVAMVTVVVITPIGMVVVVVFCRGGCVSGNGGGGRVWTSGGFHAWYEFET